MIRSEMRREMDHRLAIWVLLTLVDFIIAGSILIEMTPGSCSEFGPRGWVGVRIDRRPNWTQVASLVERAYRLVAPPRLLASLGTTPAQPRKRSRRIR